MKPHILTALTITGILSLCCSTPPPPPAGPRIDARDKTLRCMPLSPASLSCIPTASDGARRAVLRDEFNKLYDHLCAHFRRREKDGHYIFNTDTADPAAMTVWVALSACSCSADTFCCAVSVTVTAGGENNTVAAETFNTCAVYPPAPPAQSPFHHSGIMLAEFRRSFPFEKIVSLFCPR